MGIYKRYIKEALLWPFPDATNSFWWSGSKGKQGLPGSSLPWSGGSYYLLYTRNPAKSEVLFWCCNTEKNPAHLEIHKLSLFVLGVLIGMSVSLKKKTVAELKRFFLLCRIWISIYIFIVQAYCCSIRLTEVKMNSFPLPSACAGFQTCLPVLTGKVAPLHAWVHASRTRDNFPQIHTPACTGLPLRPVASLHSSHQAVLISICSKAESPSVTST